jgi:integration host factor subunit alpha
MPEKTITRADISEAIHQEIGLSRNECRTSLDLVLDMIASALVEDGEIKLSGFGSFVVRHKQERMGRNPKTKELAVVTARKIVTFKPAIGLKQTVTARSKDGI